jgi:ABC-2 type transport system ATP-binding protein
VLAALVVAASSLQLGISDVNTIAKQGEAKRGLVALERSGIGAGVLLPNEVLVRGPTSPERVAQALAAVQGVHGAVAPDSPQWRRQGVAVVDAFTSADASTSAARSTLDRVRNAAHAVSPSVQVGGLPAQNKNFIEAVYGNFPLMIALIALITFVLLARAFRSLLLPLKAVILNVISVGAAWGVLELVWQNGHGSNLIWGIAATGSITSWIPLMVFAFLFGLSMDYEVFILARMREEYDATGSTDTAVIRGIGRTGRLVTSAALILFLAFVSLASGPETEIKVLATGLAAGILLDATVIRALLVPAVVSLFGSWNWWLPQMPARLLRVEPSPSAPPSEPPTGDGGSDMSANGSMGNNGIEVDGLVRDFKGGVRAVDGIDLRVAPGEIYGFLGPNGAGKSTTVLMLTTLLPPTAGSARVAGLDVVRQGADVRRAIGASLQESALDPFLTGREHMRLQSALHGLGKAHGERRGRELLERVGLTDAADRKVGGYSGGMKRRLDLGLALVHGPRLLFLDEPTTGLDPQSRAALWDEVRRLANDGVTVFLTTQYLEEADVLADRVGIIDRGTIVAEGTPAELKASIGRPSVEIIPQDPGERERLETVLYRFGEQAAASSNGVAVRLPEGVSDVAEIVRTLDAEEVVIADLRLHSPTLDDVFLAKTGRSLEGASDSEDEGEQDEQQDPVATSA